MPKFVNPSNLIAQAEILPGSTVADLGCGSGFYTLAAANVVGKEGIVYAVDILQDKLAVTQSNAEHAGLKNITVVQADLERPLQNPASSSCDVVVMSNVVHLVTSRDILVQNAYRLLKTAGKLLLVEWKKDLSPFGPPTASRISLEELKMLLGKVGLQFERELEADGYHYAVLFIK